MLEALGMLAGSEYANAADLIGLEGMDDEVREYVGTLDFVNRAKVMNKLNKRQIPSQGSRAEMEKFFSELPKHIKEGLLATKLKLADGIIYTIKPVGNAKTIKLFESQDVKEVGLRNISNGRLPKNTALLVSGVVLLQGVATSLSPDNQKATVFDSIDNVGALCNGEFKLKANKKQLIDSLSNYVFKTKEFHSVTKGYYKLANPRLIHDDVDIEWEIELGTTTGIDPNAVLFGALHGTLTIP